MNDRLKTTIWRIGFFGLIAITIAIYAPVISSMFFILFGHQDRFIIEDAKSEVLSANVRLYGKSTEMRRKGDQWQARVRIRADASGDVYVHMKNGDKIICMVGYVSSGLPQIWRYRIDNDTCIEDVSSYELWTDGF